MGRWFTRFLSKEGMDVVITGRSHVKLHEAGQQLGVKTTTSIEAVKKSDVIILSVPINSFQSVVQEIAPYIHNDQIVFDISSIKVLPVETMHSHIKKGLVLGTHPVFGPDANSVSNNNFVLTPTSKPEAALAERVQAYLEQRGANITLMTPQEHDEMMTVVLGLSHFIAITCADTLVSYNKFKQMEAVGGSTYKVLVTLAKSIASEDPELYSSIQMSLPNMAEIEEQFKERIETWVDLVKTKNRQEFIRKMELLRTRLEELAPSFTEAHQKLTNLTESL